MDRGNFAASAACANGSAFPLVRGDTGGNAVSSSGCAVVLVRSDCLPVACIRSATARLQLATVIAGYGKRELAHAGTIGAHAFLRARSALCATKLEPLCGEVAGAFCAFSPGRIGIRRRGVAEAI